MPRLKLSDDEFDPDALDVEVEQQEFQNYTGDIPPTGTQLLGRVKKMWWTYTQNEDPMIKALVVAEGNNGKLAQYEGLPMWENLAFITSAAWKYQPFLEAIGVTLRDIKSKLIVADDEDNLGTPIEKINKWVPNGDDSWVTVVVKRDRWQGEWQAKIAQILPAEEEPEEEEAEEEPPARRRPAPKAAKAAPARRSRHRRPEPEPEDDEAEEEPEDEEDEEPEEEEEAPKRSGRTGRARASAKPSGTRRPTRRGRREDNGDEPPF
jgi:hypothetical protein